MKIVVDDKIPYLREVLSEHFSKVIFSDNITSAQIHDADALIVRTRTICNQKLLQNTRVKAIATATIGTDHIDLDYCHENKIMVCNSKGCNARAVSQWVFSALNKFGKPEGGGIGKISTIGVIGVGNVGGIVAQMARQRGFKTLLCDPPRQKKQELEAVGINSNNGLGSAEDEFVELEYLLKNSDIVTLHVPLNSETKLMANDAFFEFMKKDTTFLNASRGEVVDEKALLRAIKENTVTHSAIDVWANEPSINLELLENVNIATPHIAGYSAKGKATGTQMAVRAIANHFGVTELENWTVKSDFNEESPELYDIMKDDTILRSSPETFEYQRSKYEFR